MDLRKSGYKEITAATAKEAAIKVEASGSGAALLMNMAPAYSIGMLPQVAYATPTPAAPAAPPAEPVSEPTYKKATDNFGTMRHVEPIRDHLINARIAFESLRDFATKAPGTGKPLLERVETYLKEYLVEHKREGEYEQLMKELGVELGTPKEGDITQRLTARFFSKGLPRLGDSGEIDTDKIVTVDESYLEKIAKGEKPALGKTTFTHNIHSTLFATGTVMTDDIRTMEALRHALVKVRREQQALLAQKEAKLTELESDIKDEGSTLTGLEAKRSEVLDDYAVAQRLLAEHWQEVEQKWADRKRIIENNLGLYYVRVRETPLSRTLPDPLDLRPGSASDLVPGCPNQPTPLAEELHPFMETVLDIPASDWAALSKLSSHLPGRIHLEQMVQKRRQHIEIKLKTPAITHVSHPTLTTLLFNHQAMVQSIAARPFAVAALRDMQQQGHRILALEDLLASPIPALRDPANQLHQRLNAAAGCLLARLRAIKPSIRLAWADLADDNRLVVESPERWPNLAKAEGDDFNNIRTLVELVAWWFRQLDSDASGESRTAMRNFVRACLLLSASDDPQQLLQGQLKSLPTRFHPGELLRLDLNREPSPGNLLQLLDDKQQVIATVRVQDHDDKGTLASIATVINPNISLTLAMRVTGLRK
jgi:hypothetical protein